MKLNAVMRHLCPNFRLPEKGKIMAISSPKRFKIFPILADLTAQKLFKNNRLVITSGDLPPCTEAERQEAHATHLELLANLWHSQNILHSIAYTDWDNIKPAETIPQLRTKEYAELANLDTLKALASKAEHEFCLPFEDKFGVTQTNWAKFRQETQRGFTQISKLLNNKQSEEKWDCNVVFRQPENVLRNPEIRVTKPDFCVTKPV